MVVGVILLVLLVYVSAIIGFIWMKKIQPEASWLYLVWVVFVCVVFTLFVVSHVS